MTQTINPQSSETYILNFFSSHPINPVKMNLNRTGKSNQTQETRYNQNKEIRYDENEENASVI